MTEHDIAELLPFYANGTLDAADRARVESELASCASCAAELRDLETLGASLRARADASAPAPDRIFDAASARITAPSAASAVLGAWWGAPARYATAAVLVLGIGAAAAAAYHEHAVQQGSVENVTVVRDTLMRSASQSVTAPKSVSDDAPATKRKIASAVAPAAGAVANAPEKKPPHLAKAAQLALLVRDVDGTLKRAQATIRDAGGDVTSLADTTPASADAVHEATLNAEVPADRLDATMDRLAALGAVQNRAINAEDVGDAIVDEEARLRNLRREETDLRALMDKGGKVGDILEVQQQLSDVRGQIEQLAAQHAHDTHRVATSTIALALSEDRPNATPAKPGPTARIDGAWHAGLAALGDTITNLLATIAWCVAIAPIPLAATGAAYALARAVRRRIASV